MNKQGIKPLDPYPWLCDYLIDGAEVRSFFDGHGRNVFSPRIDYDGDYQHYKEVWDSES